MTLVNCKQIACCEIIFMKNIAFDVSVPQQGTLFITTEFGKLKVEPLEICVIQVRPKFYCHLLCKILEESK